MNVVVVTPAFPEPDQGTFMGIQRNAEGVVKGLHELGHEVKVLTTHWGDGKFPQETTTPEGIPVYRLSDLSNRFGKFGRIMDLHYLTFSRSIKRRTNLLEEADVVHSFMIAGAPATSTPWVATHQHWGGGIDSFRDLLYIPFHTVFKNYTYANIDALTSPSEFAREQLREELWVTPPEVQVVPHGVDVNQFSLGALTEESEAVRLLYAGPFESRKRLVDLVDALHELDERDVDFEVVLAGTGTRQPELERRIARYGLGGRVEFPGYLEDEELLKEYRRADLFVFPSILEGFGQVIVEAMATHTPPIVVNKPPMNEIVPSGELVVEPRNPTALADKVETLVEEDRIPGLAERCRDHVTGSYDWRHIAKRYIDVYETIQ